MLTPTLFLAVLLQEGAPAPVPLQADDGSRSASAEELRSRIHDMRMNLLLGGDRVRAAEAEAIEFYKSKVGAIDDRVDTIHVELAERRASYDIALERTLGARDAASQRDAMTEASGLRAEVASLETEASGLEKRRTHLYKMVASVEERDRERERLVAQLDTGGALDTGLDFSFGGVGLAPAATPVETSPLDNDEFVNDLLRRDPRGARRILFESDADAYWRRFPLRPPTSALKRALAFPLPDLPGRR